MAGGAGAADQPAGDVTPDLAFMDGLRETILAAIEEDWSELSVDPGKVADRVAIHVAPLIFGHHDEEIRGAPWASR